MYYKINRKLYGRVVSFNALLDPKEYNIYVFNK